jgi:hypothetical protein
MSYKRKRKEPNVSLGLDFDDDDHCNAFNTMSDTASENDMGAPIVNELNEPVSPAPGIIWFEEQKSSTDAANLEIGDSNGREFVIDENIITKYFIAAVKSHHCHAKLVTERRNPVADDTMREHGPNISSDIGILIKSWKPKEIELPLWAIVASKK